MRLLPTRRPGRGFARRSVVLTIAAVTLGGGLLAAGVASAAPDSAPGSQQYTACLNPAAGQILNAQIGTSPRKPCKNHQVQITWNQTGPVGPQGQAGPPGQQGPQGPPGENVAAGQSCPSGHYVTGFDSSGNIICNPLTVGVPNLLGLSEADAVKQLSSVGLVEGKVQHRQDPAHAGQVLAQSAPVGSTVDIVVGVSLAPPTITNPGNGAGFGPGSSVDVRWTQSEPWVTAWHVATTKQNCYYYIAHEFRDCHWDTQADTTVGAAHYTAAFSLSYQPLTNIGNYNTGTVQASVAAVDDFGTTGPAAAVQFQIG